jgi:hypothetical protein
MRRNIRDSLFLKTLKKCKKLLNISSGVEQNSILRLIDISKPTPIKIMKLLNEKINQENLRLQKMGGPGAIVQVEETMMNFKCKSHRGRSTGNRTDAIAIFECCPHFTQIWVQTIADKRQKKHCCL